jgi:hypothetical protein
VEPGASLGSAISDLETAEPRSSFIVAPFVWGGRGRCSPSGRDRSRWNARWGVGSGRAGRAASPRRMDAQPWGRRPLDLAALRCARGKPRFSAGSSGRGPPGFRPGAGVAGASPLLTSPVPRGPMAATRRANLVPRIPDADRAGRHPRRKPRAYPDRQAPRTR